MRQIAVYNIKGALYNIIRCAWSNGLQSLLLPFLLLSLLTGCERRPLEEDSYDKALIPITIDWLTLAKLDPATDHENLYRASVWFFCKDGAVFNGRSYKEFLLNDPRGGTVELPVGHYSILILNNSVDDFNGNVGFRGTDSYSTFEYYLKSATGSLNSVNKLDNPDNPVLEPEILAVWRVFEYEVTPEMVKVSRKLNDPITEEAKQQAEEDLKKLLNLQPERLTHTVHVQSYVDYLASSSKPADAILTGMASSVNLSTGEVSTTPSSFCFSMNNRQYENNSKHGRIEAYFETLGPLSDPSAHYQLTMRFTLIGQYNGSSIYPSQSSQPFSFDVTDQLLNQPAPDADYCIHLTSDDDITLPELVPGGFTPSVDDWGDEDDIVITPPR